MDAFDQDGRRLVAFHAVYSIFVLSPTRGKAGDIWIYDFILLIFD
jgi:hypothetical protein